MVKIMDVIMKRVMLLCEVKCTYLERAGKKITM